MKPIFIESITVENKKLYINVNKIQCLIEKEKHTEIYFTGEDYWNVKETPKEIQKLIKNAPDPNDEHLYQISERLRELVQGHGFTE